jgi:hypothetical protein
MDPAAIASALVASRLAQAQMAAAARLMRDAAAMDAAVVQQLLAAADQNTERLAAAVLAGVGASVDIYA